LVNNHKRWIRRQNKIKEKSHMAVQSIKYLQDTYGARVEISDPNILKVYIPDTEKVRSNMEDIKKHSNVAKLGLYNDFLINDDAKLNKVELQD